MTLDEELLDKARAAGSRLIEAEKQVQLARADYYTMIRRLHLTGGSLREVAQALDLCHQRVQQIVQEAGGTWWQRGGRATSGTLLVCTFCDRPPSEVQKMLAGPNIYICDGCIELAEECARGKRARRNPFTLASERARVKCSFCARRRADGRPVLTTSGGGTTVNICGACLTTCRQILDSPS